MKRTELSMEPEPLFWRWRVKREKEKLNIYNIYIYICGQPLRLVWSTRTKMGSIVNAVFSSLFTSPLENQLVFRRKKPIFNLVGFKNSSGRMRKIYCKLPENGIEENSTTQTVPNKNKMEEYNTAMKRMMRNPYEYHHDLAKIKWNLRSCAGGMGVVMASVMLPQKPEDMDYLKQEENVAYILNLQQDNDIEYWGINLLSIKKRCKELEICHMRRPARDFDPDSLRSMLPKAVSSLEWAISDEKGRVYLHCTAGLGRAPAVAIAYMFWFLDMDLNTAYNTLTSKRPCGPNRRAIRGATYDLAKNEPWKEPFESLSEHAFEGIADWERILIRDRVRSLRWT
ncbi:phosphoglucan phosphatase LSF2, chloroplastic [Malania oleifera]|uniref:phosphoglucan phosphatase LSF2, chloroplastic n=1 Tax=Malania oleifera TaxID=397392 RepID=UPI0025AE7814|nr:phosphoglucan phosphatase LSF2, chloroplastic [Malania oleifera]